MSADVIAMRAWNNDTVFDSDFVITSLGYVDREEAIKNYCHNTPSAFLRKGNVNECDLCRLITHAPDKESAVILEEYLTKGTLKRPLNPKPLHADREELERQVREARRLRREARRRRIEKSGRQPYLWELPLSGDEKVEQPDTWVYVYPDGGDEPELVRLSLYNGY